MLGRLLTATLLVATLNAAPASAGLAPSAGCPSPTSMFTVGKVSGTSGCQATVGTQTITVDRCETRSEGSDYDSHTQTCSTGVNQVAYDCETHDYGSGRADPTSTHESACEMEFTRAGVTVQQGCEESSATWQDGTHEQSDGCTTGVSGPVAVECSSDPYVKASIDGVEVDQAPDAPACQ